MSDTTVSNIPAAAALSDTLANPTAPSFGAHILGWDSATQWVRLTTAAFNAGAGVMGAQKALAVLASGFLNTGEGAVNPSFGNQNPSTGLLASAARTTTTTSSDVTLGTSNSTMTLRGIALLLNVTVAPNTETLTVKIQTKDNMSGAYLDLTTFGVVITAPSTGLIVMHAYPGAVSADYVAAGNFIKQVRIPPYYRVVITHSASGSWTYSLSVASLL